MTHTRRQLLQNMAAFTAVAGAGGLAACTSGGERLAVGFQRNGLLYIARTRGELDKRLQARAGVAPQWVEFPSDPPLIEAMSAGAIDFGAVGDTPVVYAQASGVDLRIVAGKSYGSGITNAFLARPGSGIATVADLKGRKVGYTRGSSAEVSALSALLDAGLKPGDITPVFLAPGDGVGALDQGAIDALFIWDPFFTIAQKRIGAADIRFDLGGLLATALFVARTPLTSGSLLPAFLDELAAEAAWADANRGEAAALLATAARLTVADIERMQSRLEGNPFAIEPPGEVLIANQQKVADILLKAGSIKAPLDVREIVWTDWTPAVATG